MQTVDYSIGVLPWVFLAAGLLIGLLAVWRLRGQPQASADLELKRADLAAERDELFAQLEGDTVEELSPDDRRRLELLAASTLKQLDSIGGEAAEGTAALSSTKTRTSSKQASRPSGFWARHPALAGALLGGGIVALVGVLIALAMEDAAPREEQASAMQAAPANGGAAPVGAAPASASQPPLPPFVQQQVDGLRATIETEPNNLAARRELALTLLSADHPFDAFAEANLILSQAPEDPEALYITGFVRYLMGQPAEAIAQFDRAIASSPDYSQAWLVKGLIQLQVGERSQAIETWEAGLSAAGGNESRLSHLIAEARTDKTVEEILANPPR